MVITGILAWILRRVWTRSAACSDRAERYDRAQATSPVGLFATYIAGSGTTNRAKAEWKLEALAVITLLDALRAGE